MMSDYDRTMELVSAANDSAGSSQAQFEKTTESLESKLNKLKDAWDAFTMGIANSDVIKFFVDLLTGLLNIINNVIDAISGNNGLVKSFVSLSLAFAGFKAGKNLFGPKLNGLLGENVGKDAQAAGMSISQSLGTGIKKGIDKLKTIDWKKVLTGKLKVQQISRDFNEEELTKIFQPKQLDFSSVKPEGLQQLQQNLIKQVAKMDIPNDAKINLNQLIQADPTNIDAINKELEKTGNQVKLTGKDYQEAGVQAKDFQVSMETAGIACTAVSAGLSLVANALEKTGDTKAAEAIRGVSTALMVLGVALQVIPPLAKAADASIKTISIIGWVATAIAGIAAVISIISALIETDDERAERFRKNAEQTKQDAEEIKQAYEEVNDSLSNIAEQQDVLKDLTKGTTEWKEAVSELNAEILELVAQYPDLLPLLKNEGGVLSIDFGGEEYQNFLDEQIEQLRQSQIAVAAADYQQIQDEYKSKKDSLGLLRLDELDNFFTVNPVNFRETGDLALALSRYRAKFDNNDNSSYEKIDKAIENAFKNGLVSSGDRETLSNYLTSLGTFDEGTIKEYFLNVLTIPFDEIFKYYKLDNEQNDKLNSVFLSNKLQNLESLDIQEDSLYNAAEILQDAIYNGIVEGKQKELENGAITDEDREAYANSRGLVYENKKYYKTDEYGQKTDEVVNDISDDTVKIYKAIQQANVDVKEKLGELESFYAKGDADVQAFLSGKASYSTLSSIESDSNTWDELRELLGEDFQPYFDQLKLSQEQAFQAGKNLVIKDEKGTSSGFIDQSDLTDSGSFIGKISSEAFTGLANNLYRVVITQGKEAASELYTSIKDITEDMDAETSEKFANALNMVDWESESSINEFKDLLVDFEVSIPDNELEEFIRDMKAATRAIDELTFEQLQEKLLDLKETIENVTSKIENNIATFTQEEMEAILKSGAADRDDFVFSGIDEYTYLGDTESLLTSINNNVAEILGLQKGNLEDSLKKAEQVESFIGDGETTFTYYTNEDDQNGKSLSRKQLLSKIVNDNVFAETVSTSSLNSLALQIGAISDEESREGIYGHDELVDLIKTQYGYYTNIASIKAQLEEQERNTEEYKLSNTDAQYFTQQQKGKDTKITEGSEGEQLVNALKTQAKNYGVTTSKIEEFEKALDANNGILDEATEAILTNAIADKKAEKAYAKTSEEIREITDDYEELKDITDEDTQLIGEALGLTDLEVGSENFNFIKENLDLIAQAAEGDIKAFDELQEKLAEHYGLIINASTGFVDLSGLVEAQEDVENAAINALNALLAAGSYEIESVEVTQSGFYDVPVLDKEGLIIDFDKKWYEVGQTYQVVKPIDAPSIKNATNNKSGSSSRNSSSGSSSKSWENPYDKFYNLTETINKNLREREKLERTYNKLLREQKNILNSIDYEKNLSEQINNLKQQADKLRREYALQSTMYTGKGQEIQSYMAKNSSLQKYGYYDSTSQQIVIDWNAINKVKSDEKGQKIEDYISKLEELRDAMWDAEDAMFDAEEEIEEMKEDLREKLEELKQAYLDFEDRIVEALVAQRQAEIDELQEVYDLMNESNNSVLSAIQEVISEQRRLRELEEQKADIEEMQRRLAMLKQDTSGASDLEIRALEEQIGDAQQSYTDSLIDQAIDEMGTANEKAEEQRQQQIDLLQHQLDWDKENGKFWDEVNELLAGAINADGSLNNNSPLVELLKSTEGYKALSEFGKENWWTNLQKTVAEAMAGLQEWLNPTDVDATIGGTGGGDTSIVGGIGSSESSGSSSSSGSGSGVLASGANVSALQNWLNKYFQSGLTVDGKYGDKTKKAVKEMQKRINMSLSGNFKVKEDGLYGDDTIAGLKRYYFQMANGKVYTDVLKELPLKVFKTGGLANFTGPAWLDGTKTHPEIVLNARDTENFLELRDVLRGMSFTTDKETSSGDNYFEVHIEVESLSNDYDVEQVADKVKRIINDDARYRNTNAINLIR